MTLLSDSIPSSQPFKKLLVIGTEEGTLCNRDRCDGMIEYETPENCSCHIRAPCHKCTSVKLFCSKCFWEEDDEIH